MAGHRLGDLIDLTSLQKLANAHYHAAGVPIGIVDAVDDSILVASGWQDICVRFHRAHPASLLRCQESDDYIKGHLTKGEACRYKCKNGLWDIGIPVIVAGQHLATLFIGQFFFEGETPDREYFAQLARDFGFDIKGYLEALDRVPVFKREKVDDILEYDKALASFIADLAEHALLKSDAETTLRESERKLHAILDQANQLLGILTIDGRVLEVNQCALNFCGRKGTDIVGRKFWETPWWSHAPDQQMQVREACQRAAEGETIQFETSHLHADGTFRYIDFSVRPVKDEQGSVILLIPEGRDITDRKCAESEKVKLQDQLLQARKMESIGRLAGGVAHDFNNMLCVILNHAEIALDQLGTDDPIHENLQNIVSAAERSALITRQLLAFARRQMITPQVLDLNETVFSLLTMLRWLVGENIELAWKPSPDLWPVQIDPTQIDQIVMNLAANARDAIVGVGKMSLETSNLHADDAESEGVHPGDYVLLSVSDNGSGMTQETMDSLFEPFFTTKAVGKGTGLGLATVYGIVQQNQGHIRVSSQIGVGTTFRIFLPRCLDLVQETSQTLPTPVPKGKETVLIVEDETQVLDLSRRLLTNLGYQVLAANSPQEAIRRAAEHVGDIHLLLTDVIMPEMDGYELAKRLQACRPGLKHVFMSGYTGHARTHPDGSTEDGQCFLQKPFSSAQMAIKVREVLDQG